MTRRFSLSDRLFDRLQAFQQRGFRVLALYVTRDEMADLRYGLRFMAPSDNSMVFCCGVPVYERKRAVA